MKELSRFFSILVFFFVPILSSCDKAPNSLTFRLNHFQLNLDPAKLADIESRKVATLLHTGLVAVDINGDVEPRLAESWKKRDEFTWVFKLRNGVTFSDGTPVDATRVVASLCWALHPQHLYSWALSSIETTKNEDGSVECTGLTVESLNTLTIRETAPVPWFLEGLDSPAGWIVGNPGGAPGVYGERPGIGPYRIGDVKTDNELELVARKDGAIPAGTDRVLFRSVSDPLAAMRMFNQGDLDLVRIENPDAFQLLNNKNARLLRHKFSRVRLVIVNRNSLKKKGFSDNQINAFIAAYATSVNREKIASLTAGLTEPMQTAFPPAADITGYNPVRPGVEARDLPKTKLVLLTINDSFSELIASYLPKKVGAVKIDFRAVESSLLIDSLFKGAADMISMLIDATSSAPIFWASFWTPGSSFVSFGTPLPVFSNLNFTSDSDVVDAARAVDRNGNWIGLLREKGALAISSRLTGLRLTQTGQVSFENVALGKR